MRHGHRHRYSGARADIHRHIVCRHQVEIEVWPPRAEVNFQDEWTANPIDTQIRFEAKVYNSDQGHLWEVRDINGNPGQGSIDAAGVYQAPAKGGLASGTTEIVVATARQDRLRKAFAWVPLVGVGPKPAAVPQVAIWPKRLELYYFNGANNNFIDDCNKEREFSAIAYDSTSAIDWVISPNTVGTGPSFLYRAPASGGTQAVTLRAQLHNQTGIFDEATILLRNYNWPGL